MDFAIEQRKYVNFKVYSVTKIKKKYGYRIILIYEDGTEVPTQRSGYATKKEANDARNITITELYNGTFVISNKVNVKTYFAYWLEKVKKIEITDDSYKAYKNIVYNYVIPKLGSLKMLTLNRSHIQKLYNEVFAFSQDVAKLCKTVMNCALEYALEHNIISSNPTKEVNLPKGVKKNPYRIRKIDIKKTLNEEQINY